ncbi:MAG: hypothetical protein LCH63_02595 [Candidatus Melainabacteria bacterium]|nr:hypothetical protein [Candidatus Melainabacteria bacterium]
MAKPSYFEACETAFRHVILRLGQFRPKQLKEERELHPVVESSLKESSKAVSQSLPVISPEKVADKLRNIGTASHAGDLNKLRAVARANCPMGSDSWFEKEAVGLDACAQQSATESMRKQRSSTRLTAARLTNTRLQALTEIMNEKSENH